MKAKATTLISTISLSVMFSATALADRQDYDASQGAIAGGAGTQEQTAGAKNSMGLDSNTQHQNKAHQNTHANHQNNAKPAANPAPSDDNSSSDPVLPVPMQ